MNVGATVDWTLGLRDLFTARQRASLPAVGLPNEYRQAEKEATEGINIQPNYGPARKSFSLTRSAIPQPSSHVALVEYIKKVRAQLRVRRVFEEMADAITAGFRIKGSAETKALWNKLGLYNSVNRIVFELITVGWCVVYVSEPKDAAVLPNINILHNVEVRRGMNGQPIVFLALAEEAKQVVRANSKEFPAYWNKEIENNMGINITRLYDKSGKLTQGGAYFVRLACDAEDIYPVPPIYPMLEYLVDSEKVLDGAGGLIDLLKTYLLHVKVGNKDGQDLRDGRPKPVSKDRLSAVLSQVAAVNRSGMVATASDVEFSVLAPPKDLQGGFQGNVEGYDRMLREDAGLPYFETIASEGVASFLARMLLPSIEHIRVGILESQFIYPLLEDLTAKGVPGAEDARVRWGVEHVYDVNTLINRSKAQLATGGASIRYLNELLDPDYDFEAEMTQKKAEQKQKDVVGMIWEPSQNLSDKALAVQTESIVPSTDKAPGLPKPSVPTGTPGRPTN